MVYDEKPAEFGGSRLSRESGGLGALLTSRADTVVFAQKKREK